MLPAPGISRVASRRSKLDLPLPLAPVSKRAPPGGSTQLNPLKTSRSPRRQERPSTTKSPAPIPFIARRWQKKAAPEKEIRSRVAPARTNRPDARFGGQTCKDLPYARDIAQRLRRRLEQIGAI